MRVGHGIRSVDDPALLAQIVDAGVTLEVCPASNVSMGVYAGAADVPLRSLIDGGARVVLGADDPLLFGSRLVDQYEIARQVHGCTDGELAGLARWSVQGSAAPLDTKTRLLAGIDDWLGAPVATGGSRSGPSPAEYVHHQAGRPGDV
jgi:adenosine deaminase